MFFRDRAKAFVSICRSVEGKAIEVNVEFLKKAFCFINLTPSGITNEFNSQ